MNRMGKGCKKFNFLNSEYTGSNTTNAVEYQLHRTHPKTFWDAFNTVQSVFALFSEISDWIYQLVLWLELLLSNIIAYFFLQSCAWGKGIHK